MRVYLSRLRLNPRNRLARRDLGDCQQLHRTVMSAFPQAPTGEHGREHAGALFRIDLEPRCPPTLLVQSRLLPDWSALPPDYLLAGADSASTKDLAGALDGLRVGQPLRFRLRANPTHAVPAPGTVGRFGRGQRRSVLFGPRVAEDGCSPEQRCLAWLERKASAGGFRLATIARSPVFDDDSVVPDVRVELEAGLHGERADRAQGGARTRLTISPVMFEGRLEVVDADLLRHTVAQGVGPAKAYGCGLLSLARV